jgi:chemotaxis protein methyltransferase CheR
MDAVHEAEEIEARLFLEAIYVRYDYDLRGYAAAPMRRRLAAALARSGLPHLGELQHRVLHDQRFFADVLHDLTVPVSELFRDPGFYRCFRARVVPVLRTYPLLRIWHAGCASGEEAYTSAIVFKEEGLYERSQIYATDLSPQSVESAKTGVYSADRLGAFQENYEQAAGQASLSNYYTTAYDRIAMNEHLRRSMLFFQHNLVSDHVFGEMHVIFCRNVLMYFGHDLRQQVLAKFRQSLCVGGFLCLGDSEQLSPADLQNEFSEFSACDRIYRFKAAARKGRHA